MDKNEMELDHLHLIFEDRLRVTYITKNDKEIDQCQKNENLWISKHNIHFQYY